LTCAAAVLCAGVAQAACGDAVDRPKVGLALSGGGALGASHIGVLQVLEELRIPVDCIAGTSMGAIVGGLYATGLNAPTLERIIADIDWGEIFTDKPPRRDRDFRRKAEDETLLLPYRIGVGDGPALPRGVVLGQQLTLALKALSFDALGVRDFDQLPIPFRAVAADIETGEAAILGDGDLATAMRASMAVSGVFPPVERDGRLLADGGLVNNLPVDVVRAMGADVVIVADIPTQLSSRADLGSAEAIVGQSISLMILRSSQQQIASLADGDVLLSPDLIGFDATSFDQSVAMIPRGAAGARAQADSLAPLALDSSGFQRHVASRRGLPTPPSRIARVRIENESRIADAVIASRVDIRPGDPVDLERIEEDIAEIYGLDYFETVSYRLEGAGEDADLVIDVREKTIGLTTARVGLNMQYDLSNGSDFTIGGQVRFAGLDELGAEVLINGAFGEENSVDIVYLQPLDPGTRYYLSWTASLADRDVPQFEDGDLRRRLGVQQASASVAFARQLATWGIAGVSLTYGAGRQSVRTGPALNEDDGFRIAQAGAQLRYDTVDNLDFPRDGERFALTYGRNLEALGAENSANTVDASVSTTNSWGRNTLRAGVNSGVTFGEDAAAREGFALGGLFALSGYPANELTGDSFALASLIGYRRLTEEAPIFDLPLYLGASVETGAIWNKGEGRGRQLWSGALFAGAETPLGPVYLGYGVGGAERHAVYISLGRQFNTSN
ncbi:MAG: patatin-like phospholipase family protein, partial [Pseudomonadota bacterium]